MTTQTFNRIVAILDSKAAVAVVLLLAGLLGLPLGYTKAIVDLYEGAAAEPAVAVEALDPSVPAPVAPPAPAVEDEDSGS